MAAMITITQIGSPIGRTKDQRATLVALGLNRIGRSKDHHDNPAIRGMVNKVRHLVTVQEKKAERS
ncbi:MAG TPA: 50S ribosomal protein L30 [Dongiaceae bacterium]|jgi:large subunit ribosomal protein L30|nr:50S ribosomal protein L30 [Dongiaceae bacterium]